MSFAQPCSSYPRTQLTTGVIAHTDWGICRGTTTNLTIVNNRIRGARYVWSTGQEAPLINVSAGRYWVTTYIDSCVISSDTMTITFFESPPSYTFSDTLKYFCKGDVASYRITNLSNFVGLEPYTYSGSGISYLSPRWDSILTSTGGVFFARTFFVDDWQRFGCESNSTNTIKFVCLNPDSVLQISGAINNNNNPVQSGVNYCLQDGSLMLKSNLPLYNRWSTGDTTVSINITQPGTYILENLTPCRLVKRRDTFVVRPKWPIVTVLNATVCQNRPARLRSNYTTGNRWSTGDTTQTIEVRQVGRVYLRNTSICSEGRADSADVIDFSQYRPRIIRLTTVHFQVASFAVIPM